MSLAKPLSPKELQELKLVFDLVDSNSTGFITSQDIGFGLRSLGCLLTEADLGELRVEISRNYNDKLSLEDFARIYALKRQDSLSEGTLLEFLRTFDRKQDGFIDSSEFKSLLQTLGERMSDEEIQAIEDFDKNREGRLNIAELARALTEKGQQL